MDVNYTPEQDEFRTEVRSFLAENLPESISRKVRLSCHVAYAEGQDRDLQAGRCQSIGLIDRALLRDLLPQDAYHVYLCGPDPFMDAMRTALVSLGVPDEAIEQESFGGASKPAQKITPVSQDAASGETDMPLVRFAKSGIEAVWDGSSNLLEFAEAYGLEPQFECRDGICGTCACNKLQGEVVYSEEPIDSPEEGQVLICCSVPKGSVILDL